MRRGTLIIIGICLLAGFLVSVDCPVRQSEIWCDPVTGTLKLQTIWPFGITAGPYYKVSSLELQLHAIGYRWPQTWQFMGKDHYTLLGKGVEFECGVAPPIYHIRRVLDQYVKAASADDVRRLADTLRFGTDQQQKTAADAAGEKGLALLAADATGK